MLNNYSISLIIPTKNEAKNLPQILSNIPEWIDETIVVDANSSDGTFNIASSHKKVQVTIKQKSLGKGAAVSAGLDVAKCNLVAIADADGSMNLSELSKFVEAFPECQIAKGSRYLDGGGSRDLTFVRSIGNRILTKLSNLLFKQKWSDLAYGYAMFDYKAMKSLGLTNYDKQGSILGHKTYGQGFEIEALIFCRAAKRGFSVVEIPSFEENRISGSSNLRAIRDGIRVLIAIVIEFLRTNPNEK